MVIQLVTIPILSFVSIKKQPVGLRIYEDNLLDITVFFRDTI